MAVEKKESPPITNEISDEKLRELRKSLEEKIKKLDDELNILKKKSGSDLWKEDLVCLENTDFYN